MKDLKQFNIQFVGLKEGKHKFDYSVDNKFFEAFNYDDFTSSSIKVSLDFVKKSTLFELNFLTEGTVEVPCDVTNELYNQEIDSELPLVVKFGPEYNDDNEEILILPHEAYEFNVAQFIYEMIVLAVPNKRVHPKVIDGTMESEALDKLKELEIKEEKTVETTDPRWDKLKNLITEKKT
ncbi:YceD family protein [Polaribacter sp. Asnod6-C07]|uniref:YceD family protein n=1 Tax=Polaribacter sp. Asnod6-C07 TaxID=3160582 RepID=UPI003865D464